MPKIHAWLPWGKNFRTLPTVLADELAKIDDQDFVVGCAKAVPAQAIAAGAYAHLGITAESPPPETWTSLLPSPNVGRTSHRNASVLEEPVKTQGKARKRIEGRAPDWKGGGLHPIQYWRDVWPKRLLIPTMTRLAFRRPGRNGDGEATGDVVLFQIQEVLNKTRPDFEDEVLRCVNLLQENVGEAKILVLDAAESAYVRRAAEEIGWEPLPAGGCAETVAAVVRKLGRVGLNYPAMTQKAEERLQVLHRLGPQRLLQGAGSFAGCFAAVFTDELVVFENLELDHALFAVPGNWRELSRLTRTELRTKFASPGETERLVHAPGWEERLTRIVKQSRGEPFDTQAELF